MARSGRRVIWTAIRAAFSVAILWAGGLNAAQAGKAASKPACDAPRGPGEPARVMALAAPDTLVLENGAPVRLAGIGVPRPPLGQEAGDDGQARSLADALSARLQGQEIALHPLGPAEDRHGRRPALVVHEGEVVQKWLLAGGLAFVLPAPGERACALREFLQIEDQARGARRGIWADPTFAVRSARDPDLATLAGRYAIVEGRVRSTGRTQTVLYLNFGPDIRRDLSALIDDKTEAALTAQGLDPDALRRRFVRVRGIVDASRGLAIRIFVPEQIERIDED